MVLDRTNQQHYHNENGCRNKTKVNLGLQIIRVCRSGLRPVPWIGHHELAGNIATRQSRIPEAELPELHNKAVALLDLLQRNLPDKTGEKGKWNFEKAHSILHKVREIILWGNSDNTSCQAPEVCDILSYTAIYCVVLSTYSVVLS